MRQPRAGGRLRVRNGVALLLAVVVLAALGMLSVTGLALARGERSAGTAALARVQARAAADAALSQALLGWPATQTPERPGDSTELVELTVPGPARGRVRLRALGGVVFELMATGARTTAAGEVLGASRLELLVLLGAPDSAAVVHPRSYPRGWRLLP